MNCDPDSLVQAAKCWNCIPPGQQLAVQTYLLAVIAGGSLDPDTLLEEAKCFSCLPPSLLSNIIALLLCNISNNSATCVTLSDAGTVGVNQTYHPVSDTEYDGVGFQIVKDTQNDFWLVLVGNGGAGAILYFGPVGGSASGPFTSVVGGIAPAPTGAFVNCT